MRDCGRRTNTFWKVCHRLASSRNPRGSASRVSPLLAGRSSKHDEAPETPPETPPLPGAAPETQGCDAKRPDTPASDRAIVRAALGNAVPPECDSHHPVSLPNALPLEPVSATPQRRPSIQVFDTVLPAGWHGEDLGKGAGGSDALSALPLAPTGVAVARPGARAGRSKDRCSTTGDEAWMRLFDRLASGTGDGATPLAIDADGTPRTQIAAEAPLVVAAGEGRAPLTEEALAGLVSMTPTQKISMLMEQLARNDPPSCPETAEAIDEMATDLTLDFSIPGTMELSPLPPWDHVTRYQGAWEWIPGSSEAPALWIRSFIIVGRACFSCDGSDCFLLMRGEGDDDEAVCLEGGVLSTDDKGGGCLVRTGRSGMTIVYKQVVVPRPAAVRLFQGTWLLIGAREEMVPVWLTTLTIRGLTWHTHSPDHGGFLQRREAGDGVIWLGEYVLGYGDANGCLFLVHPGGTWLRYQLHEEVDGAWHVS